MPLDHQGICGVYISGLWGLSFPNNWALPRVADRREKKGSVFVQNLDDPMFPAKEGTFQQLHFAHL